MNRTVDILGSKVCLRLAELLSFITIIYLTFCLFYGFDEDKPQWLLVGSVITFFLLANVGYSDYRLLPSVFLPIASYVTMVFVAILKLIIYKQSIGIGYCAESLIDVSVYGLLLLIPIPVNIAYGQKLHRNGQSL